MGGLSDLAKADAAAIMQSLTDFGQAATVTNPDGVSLDVVGLHTDISQTLDPDTGIPVNHRVQHFAIAYDVVEPVLGVPQGRTSTARGPWLVRKDNVDYRVAKSSPDRTANIILMTLERV